MLGNFLLDIDDNKYGIVSNLSLFVGFDLYSRSYIKFLNRIFAFHYLQIMIMSKAYISSID